MNFAKTTFLLAVLTVLFVIMGQVFGGNSGAIMAFIFAGLMNFGAFLFSDKIVLRMYKAHEANIADYPKLFSMVERLSNKSNMPMPKVYIIDSEAPNAFATGRSPNKASVAATTGILNMLSEDELEGVMAHELAHVKNRDTLISTIAATFAGAITWIAHMLQWASFMGRGSDEDRGSPIGAIVMAILAPLAAMLIQMAISRSREYVADKTGAEICGKPLSLANALNKLQNATQRIPLQSATPSTAHLFIVNPFHGKNLTNLFSTHPPMAERISRLKEMAK